MEEDESFDQFYAKLKDIVNSTFNLGETILEPKIVRKVLRSLLERFHAKITTIEESKDIDKIPLTKLVGNGKGFDKDHRQSSSSQLKSQEKGKKNAKDGGQYTVPAGPKCFGCQGFGHMKQECPTYLKSIGKSKVLAATLSDTNPEDDSNNEDDGILNAFTATVNPTEEIVEDVDEEDELVESKFEKMDDQDDIHTAYKKLYKLFEKHEKLYRLTTKKLSDVELDCEELSTKFDEVNQTI